MDEKTGGLWEWIIPSAFVVCCGWAIWHTPNYLLDFIPPENPSLFDQMSALAQRKDVTPDMSGLFGGFADILDWAALILIPVLLVLGMMNLSHASMEFQQHRRIDRVALFLGRVTMMLILFITLVMLYEVFLRYAIEAPTLWANELTLWIGGFVFLLSGLYGMQQRSHIRIFLLYDACPRWLQRVFDCISTALLLAFAFFLVFGSYKQVFAIKFYKWEMFGTAFDPPIPATIQPMVLIVICLVAVQAVVNLISDWNLESEVHTDEPDQEEIEALKKSVGAE
ncbi:MAG: TRAP transporter small permease [Pseudomonadota bacterium]